MASNDNESTTGYTFQRPEALLAHYTKAATAFECILPTRELRMGSYRDMQDPAENKDIVPGTAFYGDPPDPEGAWAAAVDGIKRIRDSCRLLCLTHDTEGATDTFGCYWARPRMWEQYGERHRGACVLFDRARLQGALEAELEDRGAYYMDEVRYTPAGIAESATRSIMDDRIFDPVQRDEAVDDYIENHHHDFFFLKSEDFRTEHEYRAVLMAGDADYASVDYRDALVAVVVGERFPDWQIAGAAEICEEAGAMIRYMHWHQGYPHALDAMAVKRVLDRRRRSRWPTER
jgi:Protein of unknown function (DUF2971)